jgi:hypothetical protein
MDMYYAWTIADGLSQLYSTVRVPPVVREDTLRLYFCHLKLII